MSLDTDVGGHDLALDQLFNSSLHGLWTSLFTQGHYHAETGKRPFPSWSYSKLFQLEHYSYSKQSQTINHSFTLVLCIPVGREFVSSALYAVPDAAWQFAQWSYSCLLLLGHGNPFGEALDADDAFWGSLEPVSDATVDRQFYTLYVLALAGPALWVCVSLLHGWAVVASRHFCFTIIAPTGGRGRHFTS